MSLPSQIDLKAQYGCAFAVPIVVAGHIESCEKLRTAIGSWPPNVYVLICISRFFRHQLIRRAMLVS